MIILGIAGHAGHGKDTAAGYAAAYGFRRYAFADNVRRALYGLNPAVWIAGEIDDAGVENTDAGWCVRLVPFLETCGGVTAGGGSGIGWDQAKLLPEIRQLLQRMGTEAVRDVVDREAWIKALSWQLERETPDRVAVTDVRFPNEAEAIRKWGGTVLRVVRLDEDGNPFAEEGIDLSHGSEKWVDTLEVDHEIRAGTLEDLEAGVDGILEGMGLWKLTTNA